MCKLSVTSESRMVDEAFIHSLQLTALPQKVVELLSCLLNSQKIIPSDGPDKLPRDWRGLASRVNISSEQASNISQYADKTARVLSIWMQQCPSATVGELLSHLQYIDRHDVSDDVVYELKVAAESGLLTRSRSNQVALPVNGLTINPEGDSDLLTYHDRPGYAHIYDALVLFADEDRVFVDDMLRRMDDEGFHLCTIDDLQVGHATPYAPVAHLISERCLRIILIFSPEFLNSTGMSFYMDYAQAVSIESKQRKIIPIMYRKCQLPRHLSFYHKLFYQSDGRSMYDFWFKLRQSLELARSYNQPQQQRINGTVQQIQPQSPPQIMVEEYPSGRISEFLDNAPLFLPRNDLSISLGHLEKLEEHSLSTGDSQSVGNISRMSTSSEKKKKKKNPFRQFLYNKLNFKKNKKAHMYAD